MGKIIISTDDQNLAFNDMPDIYSGSVNYDEVQFIFDESWDGFAKTVVFYSDRNDPYSCYLEDDGDDTAKIPKELLESKGMIAIGVFGLKDDGKIIKSSQVVKYKVGDGCVISNREAEETTPELWQRMLTEVQKVKDELNSDFDGKCDEVKQRCDEVDQNINDLNQSFLYNWNQAKTRDDQLSAEISNAVERITVLEAGHDVATDEEFADYLGIIISSE